MGGIDYRRLFDGDDDALLVCAADTGVVRDANARFTALTGLRDDAVTGRRLSELLTQSGDGRLPFDDTAHEVDGAETTGSFDPPAASDELFRLAFDRFSEAHVSVRVTEPGPDDSRLPADPTVLTQLVDHTPDVMWMFSADWEEYIFVNEAYEDVYGRSLAVLEENPRDFLEGIHPEDREDVLAAMQRLSAGHEVDIEYRVDPESDFERYVWVHGIPIRDDAGEVYRVAGFSREITERHERELELLRQRTLVENVPIGVFRVALGDDQRLIQANPALASMMGAERADDILGRDVAEFYADDDLAARVGDRLEEASVATFETRFEGLDDEVFWGRVTTVRQTDDDGRPIADGVIEDITTRKHRQRQLRVVDRLLRHNIRNDVSVISGYATHLAEEHDSVTDEAIQSIVDRSRDLLRTAEKGHVVVEVLSEEHDPVTFDVVPDLEATVERLRTDYEDATIETRFPPSVTVTALREIDLAVTELVENSIVHHDDEPRIAIDIETTDDAVQIRITDDGPGIPRHEYEILSGAEDVDGLSHGSGMGLWLVHWIVNLSGGDISFDSSGEGSTVVVNLPAGDGTRRDPDHSKERKRHP